MRFYTRTLAALSLILWTTSIHAQIPEAYQIMWKDPALQEQMRQNIEQHRKSDAAIKLVDASGKPLPNTTIAIQQQTHEFLFGCNLFVLGQLSTPELNHRYESAFTNLFNFATVPFYWGDLEPVKGKPRYADKGPEVWRRPPPDRLVKWCLANGVTPKGHAFMYVKNMFMPEWTSRTNAAALKEQCSKHIAEMAKRYGEDIPIWDVINEEIPRMRHTNEWPAVWSDIIPWSFKQAEKRLPDTALLLINDGTHEAHDTTDEYERIIKTAMEKGASISGIGMQFHVYNRTGMLNGKSLPASQLIKTYEQLGKLRVPLYITEITVPGSGENGSALQAEIVANLYRLWFSTPRMAGITWWNLGDGAAFQEENKAMGGLLDKDMKPKPSYEVLNHMINQEWKTSLTLTTDANGLASFRGFHGKYMVRVNKDSKVHGFSMNLTRTKNLEPVTLRVK